MHVFLNSHSKSYSEKYYLVTTYAYYILRVTLVVTKFPLCGKLEEEYILDRRNISLIRYGSV